MVHWMECRLPFAYQQHLYYWILANIWSRYINEVLFFWSHTGPWDERVTNCCVHVPNHL